MRRISRRTFVIGAVVVGIPVLALGWWLGSPLFISQEVDEPFPMSAGAVIPDDMTPEQVEAEMADAADAPDVESADGIPDSAGLVELTSGLFAGADSFHEGSGRATLYELDDGQTVLRLEAFEVTNGPDLHVLLVPHPSPDSREDVEGYVDLGSLKGNIGNQNYDIPADVDVSGFGSVVIYCQPFHVIFATASLG
jgi:hypothetical protein